jgi:hypothetical protein
MFEIFKKLFKKEETKFAFRGRVKIFWLPQVKVDGSEGDLGKFMQIEDSEGRIWFEPYSPLMLSYYKYIKGFYIQDLTFEKNTPPADIEEIIERGVLRI